MGACLIRIDDKIVFPVHPEAPVYLPAPRTSTAVSAPRRLLDPAVAWAEENGCVLVCLPVEVAHRE